MGGSVHTAATAAAAAAGRHAAAAAGELLQLAGERNDFLSVLPHHLQAEIDTRFARSISTEPRESFNRRVSSLNSECSSSKKAVYELDTDLKKKKQIKSLFNKTADQNKTDDE